MPTTTVKKATITTEELSKQYDKLYNEFDKILKKYNPCQIRVENGCTKCANEDAKEKLCCDYDDCKHWYNGCTIKCLACKAYLCRPARKNLPYSIRQQWRILYEKLYTYPLPLRYFESKELTLQHKNWLGSIEKYSSNNKYVLCDKLVSAIKNYYGISE